MVAQPHFLKMSVAAYLALDAESDDMRYEYIDGYAYMLAGGTPAHALIAANLIREIGAQLRGGPCRVYTSDAKVRLSQSRYVYPDVTVSCNEHNQHIDSAALHSPRLVIEVLSTKTEAYDRGNKSSYYRACSSIQEYVLVNTQQKAVELYRRASDNLWTLHTFAPGDQVHFANIGVTISMAAIYEYIGFPEDEEE